MNRCVRCDAKLRRAKPPWALCDPCDDKVRHDQQAKEAAADKARIEAGEPPCRNCAAHPAIAKSGIYAWLCTGCRDQARTDNGRAA